MKTGAIIVAGGTGRRMKSSLPKQFMTLGGKEMFVRSVEIFHGSDFIHFTVLVVHKDWIDKAKEILQKRGMNSVMVVPGGESRQESVYKGLLSCREINLEAIMIHDAARPFFSRNQIPELLRLVAPGKGVVVTEGVNDTVYLVENDEVLDVPDRSRLRLAETPQTFPYDEILEAHKRAVEENILSSTDDVQLFVRSGGQVITVNSIAPNPKITTAFDFDMAELLISKRL